MSISYFRVEKESLLEITIEYIYDFDVSEDIISDVTNKLLPEIDDWQHLACIFSIQAADLKIIIESYFTEIISHTLLFIYYVRNWAVYPINKYIKLTINFS